MNDPRPKDHLGAYRDQIQERIDRLESMEPAFKAMREALRTYEAIRAGERTDDLDREVRAALTLAEGVKRC